MPGIATHFKILELSIEKLKNSPDPDLKTKGEIMAKESAYAYLGAVGPTLADFIPADPPPNPDDPSAIGYGNSYVAIWKSVFKIAGGDSAIGSKGLITILEEFEGFLNKIQPIADSEDLNALIDMNDNGEVDAIIDTADALGDLVTRLTDPFGFVSQIAGLIGAGLKPAVNVPVGEDIPQPGVWNMREQMFWQKTGDFTNRLVKEAEDSGDERFMAYAYGYVTSYAGMVAGNPFINSIIGGTYRSDWWRQRWINIFVDAWTFGYYETNASMAADTPAPPYSDWPGLCDAKLYEKIDIGGFDFDDILTAVNENSAFPSVLPEDFVLFWRKAYEETYGPIPPIGGRFKPNSLNAAYLMTWAMLWFQTSGKVIGCTIPPDMTPPAECSADEPSWADPTVPGDSGGGSVPPAPAIEGDVDEGKVITGVLLALLGVAGLIAGALGSGGAAIGLGVTLIIGGLAEINWSKLRCDLFWYRMYLHRGLRALHDVMVLGGLQHPYPRELENDETVMTFIGVPFTFDSGKKNAKSRRLESFPLKPWDGSIAVAGLWINRPGRPQEDPSTIPYRSFDKYPDFFIDNEVENPLSKGAIKKGEPAFINPDGGLVGKDTSSTPGIINDLPVEFGNAVANVLDLLADDKYPNWNLDADRGLAYLTWAFGDVEPPPPGKYADPVKIHPID